MIWWPESWFNDCFSSSHLGPLLFQTFRRNGNRRSHLLRKAIRDTPLASNDTEPTPHRLPAAARTAAANQDRVASGEGIPRARGPSPSRQEGLQGERGSRGSIADNAAARPKGWCQTLGPSQPGKLVANIVDRILPVDRLRRGGQSELAPGGGRGLLRVGFRAARRNTAGRVERVSGRRDRPRTKARSCPPCPEPPAQSRRWAALNAASNAALERGISASSGQRERPASRPIAAADRSRGSRPRPAGLCPVPAASQLVS